MDVFNWDRVPTENVSPAQCRKIIHTPRATFVRLTSRKGAIVPLHHHTQEQMTLLISGAFRFETEDQTVELHAGDLLRMPSDIPHKGEALEDSVTVEVFVPAREDWILEQLLAEKTR